LRKKKKQPVNEIPVFSLHDLDDGFVNIISEFIWSESFKYADINEFGSKLQQALRYYDFLLIILVRYKEINDKFLSLQEEKRKLLPAKSGVTRMTPMDGRLLAESGRLTTILHLEIESFYQFAKVLLDNMARFLYVYFGQHFGKEKRISLKSHDNLEKHHEIYLKTKGLVIPEGFSESVTLLKNSICDYRDDEISHEMTLRRTRGTAWGSSRATRIVGGIINPRLGDKTSVTEELPQLMEAINIYIKRVIELIESNRDKSRLKLKDKVNQE